MKTNPATPRAAATDLAGPALRTFFRIADQWRLTARQQRHLLGDPPASTFFKWKQGHRGTLNRDVLERISYVFGIYKALEILLPAPERADAWVRTANTSPLFAGGTPLERMLSGNVADLYVVRQHLDANRGES
ncbi:MAG: MbcA/ParS/Xre antitoxin family protein [Rhodanobacteraceae bacterium]